MKNGRDKDYGDPKITSLDAARKRAAEGKKSKGALGVPGGKGSIGQWMFGAVVIAMALGTIGYLSKGLFDAASSLAR